MALHTHKRITPIIDLAANTVEEVLLERDFKFVEIKNFGDAIITVKPGAEGADDPTNGMAEADHVDHRESNIIDSYGLDRFKLIADGATRFHIRGIQA